MPHIYDQIYRIIQGIPKGHVLTYGLISDLINGRMSAQGVGWALKALGVAKRSERRSKKSAKETGFDMANVPWQRVVNSQGGTSTHKIADIPPGLQQHLLEAEGIVFDSEGKMDLKKYLWMEGLGGKITAKKSPAKSANRQKPESKLKSKPITKAMPKSRTDAVSESKTKAALALKPRSTKKSKR